MISLKQLATEALGLPSNILEVNNEIYNQIVNTIDSKSSDRISRAPISVTTIQGPTNIGDVTFDQIRVFLDVKKADVNAPELIQAAFSFDAKIGKEKKYTRFEYIPSTSIRIVVTIGVPPQMLTNDTWSVILDYIKGSGKKQIISTLAHELKHAYDNVKIGTRGEKMQSRMKYNKATSTIGVPYVDEFNYYIYYTYFIENLVRPTEFAAELKNDGVTKKDFLQVLKNSDLYKNLKEAENISFERMMNNMLSDSGLVETIRQFLVLKLGKNEYSKSSNEEIIDTFMQQYYKSYINNLINLYSGQITSSEKEFNALMGVSSGEVEQDKKEAYKDMVKSLNRYPDYKSFYKNEEKNIKRTANKVLRSLAKLYAYLD